MKKAIIYLPLILVTIASLAFSGERKSDNKGTNILQKTAINGDYVVFDVNNVRTYVRNNGSFNRNPGTGSAGFEWPKNSGNTAIYASGLWMGAKTQGVVRVAVAEYSYEFQAGPIGIGIVPDDSRYKVYKIKRGDDATTNSDYANWPFDDGAPALRNYNNTADSLDGSGNRIPLLLGDMTAWCVYNDNNPAVHTNMKTPPLGVEIQMTVWGFSRSDALGNAFYIRWRVINKGGRQLDSTYVSIWSDCDIGGGTDDFDGCDTVLGLGYTYSGIPNNTQYGSTPPAAGFDFLQGPIIPSVGDTVYLPNGTIKPGYKKLQMTSYLRYDNDNTIELGNPFNGQEVYNYFQSLTRSGLPIKGPDSIKTMFMYPGDPAVAYDPLANWTENGGASDRRFMMSSGPFTMMVGDTQDVVGGCLVAQGASNTGSVTALKNSDALVQKAYDLNFQLASPPPAPKVEVSSLNKRVVLTWGKDEAWADAIESYSALDPIAQAGGAANPYYNFEGYVVYQFDNLSDQSGSHRKIVQTYDIKNGITDIYDNVFDPSIGAYVNRPIERGTDKGVFRSISITKDAFTGSPLINDKDYYFAVTAYAYSAESIPKALESSANVITVRARQVPMGSTFSSAGLDTIGTFSSVVMKTVAPHVSGRSAGYVVPVVVQPDSVKGDIYKVEFVASGSTMTWRLVDSTKNTVPISDRTNMADNESHPIIDGIMFKVVDAPATLDPSFGTNGYAIYPSDTSKIWMKGGPTWLQGSLTAYDGGLFDLNINLPIFAMRTTLPFSSYKKVQIILGTTDSSWAYRYMRFSDPTGPDGRRFRFQDMQKLPIQAWDIDDPLHPRQLNIAWRDRGGDGTFHIYTTAPDLDDPLLVCASTYDPTGTYYNTPLIPGGPFETDAMYLFDIAVKDGHTGWESADTLILQPYYANNTNDVFVINTANYKSTAGNVNISKTQIERINAVPNPYFGANAYEHNQFGKVMRITNLPAKAKIRIFSLMGELIRVIDKNDPATTSVDWDLTNQNSLPVASGMYIVHIDMASVGTKIIKVAVIMAEERLDNF